MALTSAVLMSLRCGDRVYVLRTDGTIYEAEVTGSPAMMPEGKPGPGRVRISAVDVEAILNAQGRFDRRDRRTPTPYQSAAERRARRELRGDHVLARVPTSRRLRPGEAARCPHCGTVREGAGAERVWRHEGGDYCDPCCVRAHVEEAVHS